MGVENVGEVPCPRPPRKYMVKFGLESSLPGCRVHSSHSDITRPLRDKAQMLAYFKSKANREELGEMEEEANSSLCWTPSNKSSLHQELAKLGSSNGVQANHPHSSAPRDTTACNSLCHRTKDSS